MLFDRAGPGPVVAYTPAPTAPRSFTMTLTYVLTGQEGYAPEPRKRRIAGLIATLIVHVGLLWVLVTSFHEKPGLGPATMPGNGLSVFDIAGISKTEAEASVPTPSKASDAASSDKVTDKKSLWGLQPLPRSPAKRLRCIPVRAPVGHRQCSPRAAARRSEAIMIPMQAPR